MTDCGLLNHQIRRCVIACLAIHWGTALCSIADATTRVALLIGNSDYAGTANDLASCRHDVDALARWLHAIGYDEVRTCYDATVKEMNASLQQLTASAEKTKPRQAFVYYAGHGTTLPDDNEDEGPRDATDEALVGVDREPLRDDLFFAHLDELAAHCQQMIVLLDCCHSGGAIKSVASPREPETHYLVEYGVPRSVVNEQLEPGSAGRAFRGTPDGVILLTASNQFQHAAGFQMGAFTATFLRAVGARRGEVLANAYSIEELHNFLTARLKHLKQTPGLVTIRIQRETQLIPDVFPALPPPPPPPQFGPSATQEVVATLLSLRLRNRRTDWKLHVAPSRTPLQLGDVFSLQLTSNKTAQLVVFAIDPDGQMQFLLPNPFRTGTTVFEGCLESAPYDGGLQVSQPVGRERYFCYLLDEAAYEQLGLRRCGDYAGGTVEELLKIYPMLNDRLQNPIGPNPVDDHPNGPRPLVLDAAWNAVQLNIKTTGPPTRDAESNN